MKLQKYSLTLFALLVVAAIAYSETLTRTPRHSGPLHITYWEKWTGFEGDALRAVVDEYNRSQDKVHVDLLTVSAIQDKTLLAVAGGIPPDVAGLFGPNVAQYADANAVLPLDDYCAKNDIKAENYLPAYWNIGFYRNHIYALPTAPASTALHYNREMLQAAGYDPDRPPKTLEDLDAMAAKLTVRDADGKILRSGFIPAEPDWWSWGWGYLFGGKLWDGDKRITANDPANIRAMAWVQSYSKKYGPALQTFQSGFGNFSSPQNGFMSRKVAMEEQGVWMYNFIKQNAPTLKWSAVPFPFPADLQNQEPFTFVDEDILVIPRGAKHPDAAFDFIKFVQSQRGMEMLCMGQKKHTPLSHVSEDFYRNHANPYVRLFATLPRSKNTVAPPQMGIWPEYQAELKSAFEEINLMKATPKDALDHVQARMQPKLDEYLARLKARADAETLTHAGATP